MNFDLVPPKALVEWEKHLNKDIAAAKQKGCQSQHQQ